MATNRRVRSDNAHLQDITSGRFRHITGTADDGVVKNTFGRLLRVILNTNGSTVTLRNGSEVIGIIAADAPEATYDFGVYCNDSIICEAGGNVDVTVVFS